VWEDAAVGVLGTAHAEGAVNRANDGCRAARVADDGAPTLLLDESDASFAGTSDYSENLRQVLNTGFRLGGKTSICDGGSQAGWEPRDYSTYCPKAIAGIGDHLPGTVADRSIPIRLRRKLAHEKVLPFRRRLVAPQSELLRERIEVWAAASTPLLVDAWPPLPDELPDRACDLWEPLLAIADLAGPEWARRARASAVELSAAQPASESTGVKLLRDICLVFDGERMHSQELVTALAGLDESPWGGTSVEWGRTFEARHLAAFLRPFEVRPKMIRFGQRTLKGYERVAFEDAWARFLPPIEVNTLNERNEPVEPVAGTAAGDEVPF
jgi:hypothetical protein